MVAELPSVNKSTVGLIVLCMNRIRERIAKDGKNVNDQQSVIETLVDLFTGGKGWITILFSLLLRHANVLFGMLVSLS